MENAQRARFVRACRMHALDLLRVYSPDALRRALFPKPAPEGDEPAEIIPPPVPRRPQPLDGCPIMPDRYRVIVGEVCEKHGVTAGDVLKANRARALAMVRFEIYGRLHDELGVSLPQIGRLFARDHTSVLHGVRRWRASRGLPQ